MFWSSAWWSQNFKICGVGELTFLSWRWFNTGVQMGSIRPWRKLCWDHQRKTKIVGHPTTWRWNLNPYSMFHRSYYIQQCNVNLLLCANTNVVCGTDKKGRGTDYSHLWLGPSIKMVNREGHCPCLSLTNPVVCLSVCPSDSNHSMSVCDHHPIGAIRKAKGGPRAKNSLLMDWEGSHTRAFWTGVAGNGCLVPLVTL